MPLALAAVDLAQGELGEEIARGSGGDAEPVAHVLPRLIGGERGQAPANADPLAQLAQARLLENRVELRLTDQDDLDQLGGVRLQIG